MSFRGALLVAMMVTAQQQQPSPAPTCATNRSAVTLSFPAIIATPAPKTMAPTTPLSPTSPITVNPSRGPFLSPTPAQTMLRSTMGRSFTLGLMPGRGRGSSSSARSLYITGNSPGTGNVSIPWVDFFENFTVAPGDFTPFMLPIKGIYPRYSNRFTKTGIRIDATTDIVVYGVNDAGFSADAFLALPRDVLGTSYIVLGYTSYGNASDEASAFIVVGDEDDTVVTITLSVSYGWRSEGIPYNITLDALQMYQLYTRLEGEDITGTVITSNKPVAVFSGSIMALVPEFSGLPGHLIEQIPPTDTWGTTFFTVPIAQRNTGDVFRILARDDDTNVIVDGVFVATLNAANFYETEFSSFTAHQIVTTRPCLVAQYNKGSIAEGAEKVPFMMLVPPSQQYLDSYTLTTPSEELTEFTSHFINLVVLTTDLDACTLDGAQLSSFYTSLGAVAISTSGYTGVQMSATFGAHIVDCPNPFGAFVYGSSSGPYMSYGYPGGFALRKLAE